MKTKAFARLTVLLAAVAGMAFAIGAPALAQDEKTNSASEISKKHVDLNMENADIRLALKTLFKSVGANYSIAPEVKGTVTTDLKDVPFKTALETLLKSADSEQRITYRIE